MEHVGATGTDTIRFVDLCAGLGGFHRGLTTASQTAESKLGAAVTFECVAAAELEEDLRRSYVSNFPEVAAAYQTLYRDIGTVAGAEAVNALPISPLSNAMPHFDEHGSLLKIHGDMTWFLDDSETGLRKRPNGQTFLPAHDLLCAGFPCQPFSKSGAQLGFEDTRGTVFHSIATILKEHRPAFLLLENVGNFGRHDDGNTWARVRNILEAELEYEIIATEHVGSGVASGLLSPHHLGYPHHRERFFIVGQRKSSRKNDSEIVKKLLKSSLFKLNVFPSVRRQGALNQVASKLLDTKTKESLLTIITKEKNANEVKDLISSQVSSDRVRCINHWGALLEKLSEIDSKEKNTSWQDAMPSFPIWGYELDPWHWYPADENPSLLTSDPSYLSAQRKKLFADARKTISKLTNEKVDLQNFAPMGERAWLSKNFTANRIEDWIDSWPGYAGKREEWPHWKQRFISQNRSWALTLWAALDPAWLRQWLDFLYLEVKVASFQKLEWNCKGEGLDIWNHILQFRPSGLRVKRLAHVPALVAMTTTQVPIVPRINFDESTAGGVAGARGRHLIPSEALQLQGFPPSWHLPFTRERAFTCFGNAVHVGVVHDIVLNWMFTRTPTGVKAEARSGAKSDLSLAAA